jgi:hypothetical protein
LWVARWTRATVIIQATIHCWTSPILFGTGFAPFEQVRYEE